MMKTYSYKSKHYGFQMSIPEDWLDSPMLDLMGNLSNLKGYQGDSSGKKTDSKTIVGPNGKYLNVLITPLLENESEPSIKDTEEFFDGWSNRQNLNVIKTGTISIAGKEHFWATYYRGFLLTLAASGQIQFFKKYCLYLNKVEYLLTAGFYCVNPGGKLPTDEELGDSERIFDEMVSSLKFSLA